LFVQIVRDDSGPPGSIYIPWVNFPKTTAKEAEGYLLGSDGKTLRPLDGENAELADLKEAAIRRHFQYLSPEELESFVRWHRDKTKSLPQTTWIARSRGHIVGMGSIEVVDSKTVRLASGYGLARGAGAAIAALSIAEAEWQGYEYIEGEILRPNSGGREHLLRWGFRPTGASRKSRAIEQMVDLWRKPLRSFSFDPKK
jgi:hypothetical protein